MADHDPETAAAPRCSHVPPRPPQTPSVAGGTRLDLLAGKRCPPAAAALAFRRSNSARSALAQPCHLRCRRDRRTSLEALPGEIGRPPRRGRPTPTSAGGGDAQGRQPRPRSAAEPTTGPPFVAAHSSPLPPAPLTSLRPCSPPRPSSGVAAARRRRRRRNDVAADERARSPRFASPRTHPPLAADLAGTGAALVHHSLARAAPRRTSAAGTATRRRRALGTTAARRNGGGDGATPTTPRLRSALGSLLLGR